MGTNLRHGTEDVAVFEIGKGYARAGDEPREWWRLGFALVGSAEPPAWNRPARPYDLDDAKGLLELLAHRLDLGRPVYRPESGEAVFHPGRTARAEIAGRLHALVGELHPSTVEAWELRTGDAVIVGEVAIEGLAEGRLTPERAPAVGRHPEVERDLAIVVAEATARGVGRGGDPGAGAASCCGTRACSTSTGARRSPAPRRASRSGSGWAPSGRSPRPRSRPPSRRSWTACRRSADGCAPDPVTPRRTAHNAQDRT